VVELTGELFDAIEVNAARTGNHERAAVRMSRLAEQAAPGGMSRAQAHMRAGEQWLLADDPEEAVEQFHKAIADGGVTFDDPRVRLARAMFALDRAEDADALLRELGESGARSRPRICDEVAELLAERGDLRAALDWATAGVDACLRGEDRDELQMLLRLRYRLRVDLGLDEDDYDKLLDRKGSTKASALNRIGSSGSFASPDEPMERKSGRGGEARIPYSKTRSLAIDVYLDTDDVEAARAALNAIDGLAYRLGAQDMEIIEYRDGSVFRRSIAKGASAFEKESIQQRLQSLERLIELWQIDQKQAQVDQQTADAVARVVSSLEAIPCACIRFGSLLIVKYEDNGRPILLSRQLSQPEIWAFERYPELQKKPENIFGALAMAASGLMKSTEGDEGYFAADQ
jgi:hypothetical protein